MIEKKKSSKSLEKNRMAFFSAGLILVSSLSLAAFEWKTLTVSTKFSQNSIEEEVHMIKEEIITELPEPPKPKQLKPSAPQIPQISETVRIDDHVDNNEKVTITDNKIDTKLTDIDFTGIGEEGPRSEDIKLPRDWAEVMPKYPGGQKAMMKFIAENVDYPEEAKDFGEQGTAYVSFVVETDGSITDVKLLRDNLSFGLPEAAMDVVKKMPRWKPGEQRGKKVRVRFTIPIKFTLTH